MPPKILIVDDHEVVRQGVRAIILKSRPEWEVCGEAADGKEAIRAVKAVQPDVVILGRLLLRDSSGFRHSLTLSAKGKKELDRQTTLEETVPVFPNILGGYFTHCGGGTMPGPCDQCSGSGKCHRCSGSGKITSPSGNSKQCNLCGGSGTCHVCHGSGRRP